MLAGKIALLNAKVSQRFCQAFGQPYSLITGNKKLYQHVALDMQLPYWSSVLIRTLKL